MNNFQQTERRPEVACEIPRCPSCGNQYTIYQGQLVCPDCKRYSNGAICVDCQDN